MNHRTVKRKARVGERILITEANNTGGRYVNGDILTMRHRCPLYDDLLYVSEIAHCPIRTEEYEVIVEDSDNPRITALEAEVAELKAKVQTLEKADKPAVTNVTINAGIGECTAETGRKLAEAMAKVGLYGKTTSMKTPNQQRKATIERAKAFVEENVKAVSNGNWLDSGIALAEECGPLRIDFIVNAEKRTVVALPKLQNIPSHTVSHAKTVAKCNPGDVFNTDIGKAIALGRMFGKDVSEFEQAVQPTEVVVGMWVDTASSFKTMTIDSSTSIERNLLGADAYEILYGASIIDDTEAQY